MHLYTILTILQFTGYKYYKRNFFLQNHYLFSVYSLKTIFKSYNSSSSCFKDIPSILFYRVCDIASHNVECTRNCAADAIYRQKGYQTADLRQIWTSCISVFASTSSALSICG